MLEIKVYSLFSNDYASVDLGDMKSISISLSSNLFNFTGFDGSYVASGNLPVTERNAKIFNFPHKLSNAKKDKRTAKCQIWINTLLFYTGEIEISGASQAAYKFNMKLDLSEIVAEFKEKSIKSLDFGGEKQWVWRDEYTPENSDVALFPILNEKFMKETAFQYIIEEFPETDFMVNNHYNFYTIEEFPSWIHHGWLYDNSYNIYPYIFTPFPFLSNVINKIFSNKSIQVDFNIFSTGILKYLCIYNPVAIGTYETRQEGYYPEAKLTITNYNIQNHLPDINVLDFMFALKTYFTATIIFLNGHVEIRLLKDIIADTSYVPFDDFVDDEYTINYVEIYDGSCITPQPDETDELILNKEPIKNFYNGTIHQSYPTTPKEYDIYLTRYNRENSFFQFHNDGRGQLILIALANVDATHIYGQEQGYIEGGVNNQFEVETIVGNFYVELHNYRQIVVEQQGICNLSKTQTDFGLRFLFSTGMYQAIGSYNNGLIPGGDYKMDNFSLNFWSNSSLKDIWIPVLRFIRNIPYKVERKLYLSIAQLKHINFSKKILINGQLYYIESLRFNIKVDGTPEPAIAVLIPS